MRSVIVDTRDGSEIASATQTYVGGDEGVLTDPRDPNLARQHAGDYLSGFQATVAAALRDARATPQFSPERVVGIGVDTTGSTPLPVDASGRALGTLPEFADNLAAQAWLWKDHTSHAEAEEITEKARRSGAPYLGKCGGTYSSEWYWSKLLHLARTAPAVAQAAASWVELADFVPAWLTGTTRPEQMARSICAAGHKAMYNEAWGGLPPAEFLDSLHAGLSRFRYETRAVPANHEAGRLTAAIAESVGLPAGIAVAAGAFDAHMGAVGAGLPSGHTRQDRRHQHLRLHCRAA